MNFGRAPRLPTSLVGSHKPSVMQKLEADPWLPPGGINRPCRIMEISIKYEEVSEILNDALESLHLPKRQFNFEMLDEIYKRLKRWHEKLPRYMDPQEDTIPSVYILQ
jgi:hypothetical protein